MASYIVYGPIDVSKYKDYNLHSYFVFTISRMEHTLSVLIEDSRKPRHLFTSPFIAYFLAAYNKSFTFPSSTLACSV